MVLFGNEATIYTQESWSDRRKQVFSSLEDNLNQELGNFTFFEVNRTNEEKTRIFVDGQGKRGSLDVTKFTLKTVTRDFQMFFVESRGSIIIPTIFPGLIQYSCFRGRYEQAYETLRNADRVLCQIEGNPYSFDPQAPITGPTHYVSSVISSKKEQELYLGSNITRDFAVVVELPNGNLEKITEGSDKPLAVG